MLYMTGSVLYMVGTHIISKFSLSDTAVYPTLAEERSTHKTRVAAAVASATAFGSRATDPRPN